ncbi:MAG: AraD1 family protein [Litorivicinaceae bacterium]
MSVWFGQIRNKNGEVEAIRFDGRAYFRGSKRQTSWQIILESIESRTDLATHLTQLLDVPLSESELRWATPVTHPEPHRCWVTGTGLTHLGSAATRDSMHQALADDEASLSDSMKMFRFGLEGGKPAEDKVGAQPEWFYKGNGLSIVEPGGNLDLEPGAMDGGDESELAGIYVIRSDGQPVRVGFAVGNEFSDHVMEKINYLYLAHSKPRVSSFGPLVRVGEAPASVHGKTKIKRDGEVIWEKSFTSGNDEMCHAISNLEHHHFKYPLFRNPGDLHVHYMGTSLLSFADGIRTQTGDAIVIEAEEFGPALENTVRYSEVDEQVFKIVEA